MINFQTSPDRYQHWKLQIEGPVATLSMDVQEDQTLAEGYKLKLNSYDLGVDIELADSIQRLRSEDLLRRREHLHARDVVACVQGQLL